MRKLVCNRRPRIFKAMFRMKYVISKRILDENKFALDFKR